MSPPRKRDDGHVHDSDPMLPAPSCGVPAEVTYKFGAAKAEGEGRQTYHPFRNSGGSGFMRKLWDALPVLVVGAVLNIAGFAAVAQVKFAQNDKDHDRIFATVDRIDREGTTKGQPIYRDMLIVQSDLASIQRKQAAQEERDKTVIDALKTLQQQVATIATRP